MTEGFCFRVFPSPASPGARKGLKEGLSGFSLLGFWVSSRCGLEGCGTLSQESAADLINLVWPSFSYFYMCRNNVYRVRQAQIWPSVASSAYYLILDTSSVSKICEIQSVNRVSEE